MKRYEILLGFINTNMKEIEQMVSGGEYKGRLESKKYSFNFRWNFKQK